MEFAAWGQNRETRASANSWTVCASLEARTTASRHSGASQNPAGLVSTNTVEGFFSIFKRGMHGIYQHCGEHHLHPYLAEFGFRYSYRVALGYSDDARAIRALKGIEGNA